MRLYLLLLGIVAGLWFSAAPNPLAAATATPRPTPTLKACHICDEQVIPAVTPTAIGPAEKDEPVVHAVMFWMATCPHCHIVLNNVLPPLQQKYGNRFQLALIEVTGQETWNQLVQAGTALGIPVDRLGVPFLIIGNQALIGSGQIPAELPGLIEHHLAAGGVDYPDLPGLDRALPAATPTTKTAPLPVESCSPATPCAGEPLPPDAATPAPVALPPEPDNLLLEAPSTVQTRPNGFGLAIGVMAGMVVALGYSGLVVSRRGHTGLSFSGPVWPDVAIPLLAVAGLGVAGYLAYVETQAVPAVCGPVGDCNAVQASPYARLFGILPVGVLGVIGYVAILAVWLWGRFAGDRPAGYAYPAIFGMALAGVLFSLYLTYLEPFVIGAVCIWCLTSAVIITLLMVVTAGPARREMWPGNGKQRSI